MALSEFMAAFLNGSQRSVNRKVQGSNPWSGAKLRDHRLRRDVVGVPVPVYNFPHAIIAPENRCCPKRVRLRAFATDGCGCVLDPDNVGEVAARASREDLAFK